MSSYEGLRYKEFLKLSRKITKGQLEIAKKVSLIRGEK